MADPLSIGVSVLAIVTAAVKSANSLCATVQRYKARDKTLNRLHGELEDLAKILGSLEQAVGSEAPMWALLEGPVDRCSTACREFEEAMQKFGGKSTTGLRDWAKMEFMRDDINGFIDTLADYKSTIAIGLGTVTIHHSKLSQKVFDGYNEMIKDTVYNLEVHMQRIEDKMAGLATQGPSAAEVSIDLQNEKDVTIQCLRICEEAKSFFESLRDRQPALLQGATPGAPSVARDLFEAELRTTQMINENRGNAAAATRFVQERLDHIAASEGPERDQAMARLREEMDMRKQCLELCREAEIQVSHKKIYIVREVVADDDTDQVVVTTLADLFDVGKVLGKGRSAQLVGSMADDTLQRLSSDRYSSRFGTVSSSPGQARSAASPSNPRAHEESKPAPHPIRKDRQPESRQDKPSSNEVRKRAAEGGGGA